MTRKHTYILITLALGVFMGALDMSIVSPAFTTLQQTLHVTANTITWTLTTYTLVYVVSQPLTAKLSDNYGRKWIYVTSVGLFGLGSLICGLASSLPVLLIGRAVQAAGAGGVIPVASAVIGDTFPKEKRGMALGITGSLFGVAAVLGPNVGGWFTANHSFLGLFTTSWRDVFFLNVPLAIIVMFMASRMETIRAHGYKPFDALGALFLSAGLFSLIYALTQLNFNVFLQSVISWPVGPLLLVALILLIAFVLIEQRVTDPLINTRLFTQRQIMIASLLSISAGICIVTVFYIPVLAQYVLNYKPDQAGSMVTVAAFMLLITTPLVGMLIDRVGARAIIVVGALITTVALYLLSIVPPGALWLFILALSTAGVGLASFLGTPIRYIVLNEAHADQRASSLSILSIFNSLGQTIGVPLAGSMVASRVNAVTGLHQFYLLASIVLAVTVIISLFLKSHKQELAMAEMVS